MATIKEDDRKRINQLLREVVAICVKNGIDTSMTNKLMNELNQIWTEVNQTKLFI